MPGMTGVELAVAIRQTHPLMPIVLATGYADFTPGDRPCDLPRLNKPFGQQELAAAIARHCFAGVELPTPAAPYRPEPAERRLPSSA